jgi:hypothetical protein
MCVGFVLKCIQNYHCSYNCFHFLKRPEFYCLSSTTERKNDFGIISTKISISTSYEMEIISVVHNSFYNMVEDVF